MGRRKKNHIDTSARSLQGGKNLDDLNFRRLVDNYTNIALNIYEWTNLPKGIESRFIERALFDHGQCFIFQDENLGYLALPCSNSSNYNVYGEPLNVIVTGRGYTKQVDIGKGVRILNNSLANPSILDIWHYCKKIDDLEFSISRNLKYQNSPFVVLCTKDTEFAAKIIMDKIENNELSIIVDKNMELNAIDSLKTIDIKKEFIADRLRLEQLEYEKQLLTKLSLNCTINKEGGMSTTELNSNNMLIEMVEDVGLTFRKKAAKEMNEKFGWNIEVDAVANRLDFMADEEGNLKIEDKKENEGGVDG